MFLKALSLSFLGLGVFVLMQVVMPYLAFASWEVFSLDGQSILADPHPSSAISEAEIEVQEKDGFSSFVVKNGHTNAPYNIFQLSIPSLQINSVKVEVNSYNFEENLSHLPGSALPGEKGNIFVTGHSGLDSLALAKRYAYFVNLPNIKKGDEVIVTALGQQFKYIVEGLRVVDPKDISVINPPDGNGRYLTLMTCVPPGFSTKRLIVLTKLKT